MNVLLVSKKGKAAGVKVIVRLHTKSLREKVSVLLKQNRQKEAFDLVASKAPWQAYIPEGKEPYIRPDLTLVEDI